MGKEPKKYTLDTTKIPVSQAHLEHLFWDSKTELKAVKAAADAREANLKNQHVFTDHSVVETLLLEIGDKFLLDNHPNKVLNNLVVLDKKFSSKDNAANSDLTDLLQNALRNLISKSILSFSLGDFGIVVSLSRKYLANDAAVWNNLSNNFCRLI